MTLIEWIATCAGQSLYVTASCFFEFFFLHRVCCLRKLKQKNTAICIIFSLLINNFAMRLWLLWILSLFHIDSYVPNPSTSMKFHFLISMRYSHDLSHSSSGRHSIELSSMPTRKCCTSVLREIKHILQSLGGDIFYRNTRLKKWTGVASSRV